MPGGRSRRRCRVITRRAVWACIESLVLKLHEDRTVKLGGALLHDNINNATESSTILGLHARALDLDFLNKIEGHVRVRVPADQIRRLLPFNEIRVLGIGTPGDRISKRAAVAAIARRDTAAAIGRRVSHQRLVASRGSKLNDRLKGCSARDEVDYILGDVRERCHSCDINRGSRRAHLNHSGFTANRKCQVDSRKVAYLENQPLAL